MNIVLVDPIAATANLTPMGILRPQVPSVGSDPHTLRETKLVEIAGELAKLGHRATVLFGDRFVDREWTSGRLRIMPLHTVLRVPFHPGLLPATPALLGHPVLQEADIVQTSEFHQPSTFLACLASRGRPVPVVVWQETFRHMRFPGSTYQRVYETAVGGYLRTHVKRFIPRTTRARAFLRDLRVAQGAIAPWIPTGINVDAFAPRETRLSPVDLGMPKDAKVLLLVARLHWTKGIDQALRMLRWVLRRRPDVVLVIRGSGPQELELRALAKDLGIEGSVRFCPRRSRDEMVALYNLADLVLCTSRIDLMPFSLMEASACGRPCVATDVGAIRDVVMDGRTGVVTRDGSAEGIGTAVLSLLDDGDRRATYGAEARRRAERHFALPVVARRLLKVYCDVAS